MTTRDDTPSANPSGPRWQYSVRTLLLLTFGTAVALAIVVSLPSVIAVPVMICLAIAIPAVLTVVLVSGSRYQRAFCIGAMFPTCTLLYVTGWLFGLALIESPSVSNLRNLFEWMEFFNKIGSTYRIYTGAMWMLAVVVGSVAVVVRYRMDSRASS